MIARRRARTGDIPPRSAVTTVSRSPTAHRRGSSRPPDPSPRRTGSHRRMRRRSWRFGAASAASPTSDPRRSTGARRRDAARPGRRGRRRRRLRSRGRRTAAGSVDGRAGAPATGGRRRCAGTTRPALEASGRTARRLHQLAVKCCASGVSAEGLPSTEPSAESGRWPGTRGSRISSGGPSRRSSQPPDVRAAWTMFGRRRHQHVDEFHQAIAVVVGHREHAPRHPGQPGTGRDEQRGARRCDTLGQQLPRRGRQQLRPQRAGDAPVRWRATRTGPWRWPARRRHAVSRSAWVRQRCGQLVKRRNKIRFLHHPGDRP